VIIIDNHRAVTPSKVIEHAPKVAHGALVVAAGRLGLYPFQHDKRDVINDVLGAQGCMSKKSKQQLQPEN